MNELGIKISGITNLFCFVSVEMFQATLDIWNFHLILFPLYAMFEEFTHIKMLLWTNYLNFQVH